MQLEIISPEKVVYKQDIDELTAETVTGQISILPNHVNLLTELSYGEVIIKQKGKEEYFAATGGFLEVKGDTITILADYAVHAEHIDIEKAIAAEQRAKEMLKKAKEQNSLQDFTIASSELHKSLLELKVAKRRRRNL